MALTVSGQAAISKRGIAPLQRKDLLNLGLLLVGFVCFLVLVPPARSYPTLDDWIYARGVEQLLSWHYTLLWSQATALGSIAWGAVFAGLFGFSFTVLSVATLVMSAAGLGLFYLLLRYLKVTPGYALLGTALLGLNPIYVFLSYSFMTDIPFLTLLTVSMLCYLLGSEERGTGLPWLFAGSVLVAWAYLTRQFGILLVPIALLYLWWSHKWTWRAALAIGAFPALVAGIYALWERTQPVPLISLFLDQLMQQALSNPLPYLAGHIQMLLWAFTLPGIILLPLLGRPRRFLPVLLVVASVVTLQLTCAHLYGTFFPQVGNVVDDTGFIMWSYTARPIWTQAIWTVPGIIGSASVAIMIVACAERIRWWLRSRPWPERSGDPVLVVYAVGLSVFLITVFVLLLPYDRDLLPVLAVVIIAALRRMSIWASDGTLVEPSKGQGGILSLRVSLVALLGLFSILAQHDYNAHANARWQAAEGLAASGVPRNRIDAGFEWAGWYMYDEGERRIRETGDRTYLYFAAYAVMDPEFRISDLPEEGYAEVGSVPYSSWLSGGETRKVLELKRK